MEAGDVIWLLFVLFWLVSGVLRSVLGKKKRAARPAATPPGPPPVPQRTPAPQRTPVPQRTATAPTAQTAQPPSPEDAVVNLLKRLGVDVAPSAQEQPVAGEHSRTPGEHAPTASETRRTAAEHAHTPGWHDRTASEIRPTASEHAVVPSEHRLSAGEHRPGDVRRTGVAPAPGPRPAVRGSGFGRRTVAALRGRESLARAIVLKEILGPPVGLRTPGGRIPDEGF